MALIETMFRDESECFRNLVDLCYSGMEGRAGLRFVSIPEIEQGAQFGEGNQMLLRDPCR